MNRSERAEDPKGPVFHRRLQTERAGEPTGPLFYRHLQTQRADDPTGPLFYRHLQTQNQLQGQCFLNPVTNPALRRLYKKLHTVILKDKIIM